MGPDLIVIKGTWAWKPIKLNSSSSAYLLILWPWEGELIPWTTISTKGLDGVCSLPFTNPKSYTLWSSPFVTEINRKQASALHISIRSSNFLLLRHLMPLSQTFTQKWNHLASSLTWNFLLQMNLSPSETWIVLGELSLTLHVNLERGLFYALRNLRFIPFPKEAINACMCSHTHPSEQQQ